MNRLGLTPVQETLLLTLHARARDAATTRILDDRHAAEVADRLNGRYDFAKLRMRPSLVVGTALRNRGLDDAVRRFTSAHQVAVVIDLGAGLDTRALRCTPPAGVDWFDVDFPEVIALRRELVPEHTHLVGADATEHGWLAEIPAGRPAIVVADGFLPFLPGDAFAALTRALAARLPRGELAFNGYTRFAAWAMRYHPSVRALGIKAAQGFDDAREPEGWGAGLALLQEQFLTRAPEVARFPGPVRTLTRLMARSAALSRQGTRILRYGFRTSPAANA
ncbi:class I SAM-dependent methyltransferase [Streptomyces sp. NPDC004111]|uniref:class I SAM-dependent methyltransferase n=1 Tax=Streptomyces sp. NPDC004111 TaxID=3364690 RepID=UPI0036B2F074